MSEESEINLEEVLLPSACGSSANVGPEGSAGLRRSLCRVRLCSSGREQCRLAVVLVLITNNYRPDSNQSLAIQTCILRLIWP